MIGKIQPYRLDRGGSIDRSHRLSFRFDDVEYEGYEGDTLASALLANGVRVVARSFKYHRPRGIFTAGAEEPNALVTVGAGARATPNTRATQVWLRRNLQAFSQNRWPSLRFDLGALNGALAPLLAAGFYYKTFMRPRRLWPYYEHAIRHMAGMGVAPVEPDPDRYEKEYRSCECLVVGLGPAGLAAALAASQDPARRIVALDMDRSAGGSLSYESSRIDGLDGGEWAARALAKLASRPNVTVLLRTTAFGYYDDNLIAAVEQPDPGNGAGIRERVHWIRAGRVILATGAHERPIVFSGNDRPGIMLASAARTYLNRYAVTPGRRVAVLTNNDSAYPLAHELAAQGIEVAALIDMRPRPDCHTRARLRAGYRVTHASGRSGLRSIEIEPLAGTGPAETIPCDALFVSGGWVPAIQLHAHAQGEIHFEESLQAFVPGAARQAHVSVGAAAGAFGTAEALEQGWRAGGAGVGVPTSEDRSESRKIGALGATACVSVPARTKAKAFVDLQNDVATTDIALATREGFDSVEHLKRYTTLGMGTDQGKTSNLNGLGLLASATGRTTPSLGVTTFRPPYVPVTFGAIAGAHRGHHFAPTRHSPLHARHVEAGALFVDAGLWRRPRTYPRAGESPAEAVNREVLAVRNGVGMVDVSTLGKIDIQGRDSLELLERVYCNKWRSLEVGKARYGLMLREDGIVLDDGTTSRIGPHRYFMTTSTAHAAKVMSHLEYCAQVLWPELDVHITSVTEQWCAIAVAGPKSRGVVETVLGESFANGALPPLGIRPVRFCGELSWIARVSFSGELAFEVYVPSDLGPALWDRLMTDGRPLGLTPYGTDALTVLRVEKGHVAGPEIDGRTTPADLGLARLRSSEKTYVGRQLGEREGLKDPSRPALVGLVPLNPAFPLRAGMQIVAPSAMTASLGHTTTAVHSATLGHSIALALVSDGSARKGEELLALDLLRDEKRRVRVVDPVFVDLKGDRMRA